MDIHRSRFVPYPVYAITAVTFSRSNDDGLQAGQPQPALKLAIGRQNGDIEIWNPLQGTWMQEVVFTGDHKSVDGLAWTREPDETDAEGRLILGQHRLFSIASSPTVTEWDLELGQPKRRSTGNFSEVWCLAAQPQAQSQISESTGEGSAQELVVGCGDGTIVQLSTTDNDLQFKRFLARVGGRKAKCVSISYQNRDRVLAGFMDSTIRVFDMKNGSMVRTMSLGVGIPGAPKDAVIWQVKTLPNGDIVSGDSNGEVVFWDGRSYSLTQRIKGHDSECLDVVTAADGKTVFSGSMDGRIAVYRQSTNPAGRKSWTKNHHRRTHSGEVKAMSAFDSKGLSVVVSGGDDLVPTLTPLREYGRENVRTLPTMPQRTPVVSARHARLFASWWDKTISVWRIARKATSDVTSDLEPPRKLVAKISLNTKDSIRSVSMPNDGKAIAASTNSEVKVFQLRRRRDVEALGIRKVEVPSSLANSGAHHLCFSPDGKWLAAVSRDNEIQIARLTVHPSRSKHILIIEKVAELERRHRPAVPQSGFKDYDNTIVQLAFAPDSSVLAAGDLSGNLDSWVLMGNEDPTAPPVDISNDDLEHGSTGSEGSDSSDSSDGEDELYVYYGQHWADNPAGHLLAKLESAPLVFSFRPSPAPAHRHGLANGNPGVHSTRHNPHAHSHELPRGQHRLWIMTARHQMYEFDILAGRLSDWSRQNPTSVLPEDFTKIRDRVKGAVWDVHAHHERLWLYGSSWMFMLNACTSLASKASPKQKKRKGGGGDDDGSTASSSNAKRIKTNSGAGARKDPSDREALPSSLKRYEHGAWTDVQLDPRIPSDNESEEGEGEAEDADADARLRLTRTRSRTDDDHDEKEDQQVANGASQAPPPQQQQRKWWYTFKYRPILGMVPIEDDDDHDDARVDDERTRLEVVLVERPLWDVREEEQKVGR